MRRLHLLEIEDQPWCPRAVRDTLTDTLRVFLTLANPYGAAVQRLRTALDRCGARRIVDLASGGGGPWPRILRELDGGANPLITVCLTDRYPNRAALGRLQALSAGRLHFHPEPVDVRSVPPELGEFRTVFTAFHHFRPELARAVLEDAVRSGQGIAVLEVTSRRVIPVLLMLFAPLAVLLAVPVLRPFRWSRLLWTYLLPLAPIAALFDGVISCIRAYSPSELRALTAGLGEGAYRWEIGEVRGGFLSIPVTCLIGYPDTPAPARP